MPAVYGAPDADAPLLVAVALFVVAAAVIVAVVAVLVVVVVADIVPAAADFTDAVAWMDLGMTCGRLNHAVTCCCSILH